MSTVGSDSARTWRVGDVLVTRIEEASFRLTVGYDEPSSRRRRSVTGRRT